MIISRILSSLSGLAWCVNLGAADFSEAGLRTDMQAMATMLGNRANIKDFIQLYIEPELLEAALKKGATIEALVQEFTDEDKDRKLLEKITWAADQTAVFDMNAHSAAFARGEHGDVAVTFVFKNDQWYVGN